MSNLQVRVHTGLIRAGQKWALNELIIPGSW
ncbi:MAG: hypothetical protein JWQ68_2042, partial [Cryobacterium sp.]|nr:hypothetical protein [Cryobacterium sp.]